MQMMTRANIIIRGGKMAFNTPVAVGDHPNRFPTSGAAHPSSLFLVCGVFLLHRDAQPSVCFCFIVVSFIIRLVSPDVLVACEASVTFLPKAEGKRSRYSVSFSFNSMYEVTGAV